MAYPRTPEHNLLRALPFFLVALLLALMGWAGYRDYKDLHRNPKPKHETAEWVTYSGSGGQAEIIPYTKLHTDGDCVSQVNGHVLCNPDAYGRPCKRIASGGWQCGDPSLKVWNPGVDYAFQVTRPRKHKRKADGQLSWYDFKFTPIPNQPYESWRLVNMVPSEWDCTRMTKTSGMDCQSTPQNQLTECIPDGLGGYAKP